MPTFNSNGVTIHYETFGADKPIVLVHGFASSFTRNWRNTSWVECLTQHGYQVIGPDMRGHGASEKFYDPQVYGPANMAGDVLNLMDHLNLAQADLMGYSMGGGIALYLAMYHPERLRKVVLGGIGDGAIREQENRVRPNLIASALEAATPEAIDDPIARQFRSFAERTANDLKALAAVMRRPRAPSDMDRIRQIALPVLIVVGERDKIAGGAARLAETIPNAQLITIPDRDHLSVVGDQRYKDAVLAFLTKTE